MFFWTKPLPNACPVYFAVLLALKEGIDALDAFCGALSLFLLQAQGVPFLGQVEERKNVEFLELDWNLEHRNTLTRCISGKESFGPCLIRCWYSLAAELGFPQPQKGLIQGREWTWRLTECAERRTAPNIPSERPDGLYATSSCSPESPPAWESTAFMSCAHGEFPPLRCRSGRKTSPACHPLPWV